MSEERCARCGHYTFIRETIADSHSPAFSQASISRYDGETKVYTQRRPKGTQKGHLDNGTCRSTKGFHWQPTEEFWPDGRQRFVKITDPCSCPAFVPPVKKEGRT